jgi:hypothetical protein
MPFFAMSWFLEMPLRPVTLGQNVNNASFIGLISLFIMSYDFLPVQAYFHAYFLVIFMMK